MTKDKNRNLHIVSSHPHLPHRPPWRPTERSHPSSRPSPSPHLRNTHLTNKPPLAQATPPRTPLDLTPGPPLTLHAHPPPPQLLDNGPAAGLAHAALVAGGNEAMHGAVVEHAHLAVGLAGALGLGPGEAVQLGVALAARALGPRQVCVRLHERAPARPAPVPPHVRARQQPRRQRVVAWLARGCGGRALRRGDRRAGVRGRGRVRGLDRRAARAGFWVGGGRGRAGA